MFMLCYQQSRMISGGSCDTEACSNGSSSVMLEFSFVITGINYFLKTYYNNTKIYYFKLKWYFTILPFLLYFPSNKCSIGRQKHLYNKNFSYFFEAVKC